MYGDIGTSPLYALRESFGGEHDLDVVQANVLGVLSLIFWSLILVITIKYLLYVMRADNEGEGGILALTSLVTPRMVSESPQRRRALILIGLFGTALLYGDGMITPAISVLSAVEGAEVATPRLEPWVDLIAVVILIGLFAVQRHGTGAVGAVFGPVMVVWFTVLAVLGLAHLADAPRVLQALDPTHAYTFFANNGLEGFLVLGSVFLVVTGGEALYADMGHFGRGPIRLGWFALVLPALLCNYFGQGALVLDDPSAIDNPFYRLAPSWGLYPLTILATAATVIASQALISGAFSLTAQAIQLDYSPRMRTSHTSEHEIGQIYLPAVNWALMVACIGLVLGFRSSTNLAAAYGVAVTMTMFITTVLLFVVMRERWEWSLRKAGAICTVFLVVDLAFLGANLFKIPYGGWFPLAVGAAVFTLLTTWRTGRRLVRDRLRQGELPFASFVESVMRKPPPRVPGTAVFLYSEPGRTPPALLTNFRYNEVLHEHVVVLSVVTEKVPRWPRARRAEVASLGHGFSSVTLRFGFQEEPDVARALADLRLAHVSFDPLHTVFFLGKERVRATERPGMARWRERLFGVMLRNAGTAGTYFGLPDDRTVEVAVSADI